MSDRTSPLPEEDDVRLTVYLHGVCMNFVACTTAALVFVEEHRNRHYLDSVEMLGGDTSGLERLPNERLYLQP